MLNKCRIVKQFSSSVAKGVTNKENIGQTGIARSNTAATDLLAAYSSFQQRLDMSSLPDDYVYKNAMKDYLNQAIATLRSPNPKELEQQSGMQFEQLVGECEAERELLEALELDRPFLNDL